MTHGSLFFDDEARLGPPCSHGNQSVWGTPFAPGWQGPHHCAQCASEVDAACLRFEEGVQMGRWDAAGYTPAERRAQDRRKVGG
jgi:hypothetical protein